MLGTNKVVIVVVVVVVVVTTTCEKEEILKTSQRPCGNRVFLFGISSDLSSFAF